MLLAAFEIKSFLLALSWAIINSIWQSFFCWIFYKAITFNKSSAIFRYNAALILLIIVLCWFILTFFTGYNSFNNATGAEFSKLLLYAEWVSFIQHFPVFFQLIAICYLLVFAFNSIGLVKQLINVSEMTSKKQFKAPIGLRLFLNKTVLHFGISKKVELWLSKEIHVPCVSGLLKPVILLPFSMLNNLDTAQAEAIIVHELAHIKRNDFLINVLQSIVDVIMFFNPFAILLSREVRKEREHCCDDWVICYQYDKKLYASALLSLEKNREHFQLLPAATGKKGLLLDRVKRLFIGQATVETTNVQKFKLSMTLLVALFAICICMPLIKQPTHEINSNQEDAVAVYTDQIWSPELTKLLVINNNNPVSPIVEKQTPGRIKLSKKINTRKLNTENKNKTNYTIALVNNELMEEKEQIEDLSNSVALFENVDSAKTYLIKVDIEQSGSLTSTSYLLEYNKDGNAVKPLMIVSKKTGTHLPGISKPAIKKLVEKKKRITS